MPEADLRHAPPRSSFAIAQNLDLPPLTLKGGEISSPCVSLNGSVHRPVCHPVIEPVSGSVQRGWQASRSLKSEQLGNVQTPRGCGRAFAFHRAGARQESVGRGVTAPVVEHPCDAEFNSSEWMFPIPVALAGNGSRSSDRLTGPRLSPRVNRQTVHRSVCGRVRPAVRRYLSEEFDPGSD